MPSKRNSSVLPRVIVACLIILGTAGFYSIVLHIWQGETLTIGERVMGFITIIIAVVAFVYVAIQRLQMRKTETFRREKW